MATSPEPLTPRPRVLLIAKATPFIWVHHYVKAFRACCEVITVGPTPTLSELEKDGRARLAHLVAPNDICNDLQDISELQSLLPGDWTPDLLVTIQSGMEPPRDIERLPCPTAYISVDSWHDSSEFINARPYEHVFVAQREFVDWFRAAGCGNTHWLPLACDPLVHRPVDAPKEYDVAFVGSCSRTLHAQRVERLARLARRFTVLLRDGLSEEEMRSELARGRLAFNSSVAQDVNMRVFEVMAMGLPLLTNRDAACNGLFELFDDRKHLIAYDDDTLLEVAREYLRDAEARSQIAQTGRQEVVAKHTYAHRVRQIIDTVLPTGRYVSQAMQRQSGDLLAYLPNSPGIVVDLEMSANTSKYAMRRRGADRFIGVVGSGETAAMRRNSYDDVWVVDDIYAGRIRADTAILAGSNRSPVTEKSILLAWDLLKAGGTLIAAVRGEDIRALTGTDSAEDLWRWFECNRFAVLLADEKRSARSGHSVVFLKARKQTRSLREVIREVYERHPLPGLSMDTIISKLPDFGG
ncbi:MAG: hypothetical protein AMXMBFR4_24550 [Candidatus Hydrogenedentota bacterium]